MDFDGLKWAGMNKMDFLGRHRQKKPDRRFCADPVDQDILYVPVMSWIHQSVRARASSFQSVRSTHRITPSGPVHKIHSGLHFPAFFSQSLRNAAMPLSVKGWSMSCFRILNGTVAICAPAMAASRTCKGLRTLAAMIRVEKP